MLKARRQLPKSRRRTSSSTTDVYVTPVTFRRIILITTCLVLFFFAFTLFANKGNVTQSVAGISVARGLFAQATVQIPQIDEAVSYNIYYKEKDADEFNNAVRNIPASVSEYTISYLNKNASYDYKIAAVNKKGSEFLWSEVKTVTELQPM